jgi:hypothetical protein
VPKKKPYRADIMVLLSVLILLAAGDLLSLGGLRNWVSDIALAPIAQQYFGAAVLSGLVGFAELVSRYRDEPWRIAKLPPGLVFIGLNAFMGCLALFLMQTFPEALHPPSNPVAAVMVAGFGAMVVIRTKLVTIHQPGGTDVAVGPAFIVDTMLAAINRNVDRRRAFERTTRVSMKAAELGKYPYWAANDFLIASMGAFQNMDPEIAKSLRSQLQELVTHPELVKVPDQLRLAMAGYSILTEFGDRAFDGAFEALRTYLVSGGYKVTTHPEQEILPKPP